VEEPETLRKRDAIAPLEALAPDVLVVAAYGKILPRQALQAAKRGGLNLHPSLLPRHRGPSPVQTTILEGDAVTGVTIICMDEGMDSGPILVQRREPVRPDDTSGTLLDRLFRIGTEMLMEVIDPWVRGELNLTMQDHASATFTRMLQREDAALEFEQPAVQLERRVRAFQPAPGAYTFWDGKMVKVIESAAVPLSVTADPGVVVALPAGSQSPIGVATAEGALALKRMQLEGKRPMTADEFLRGYRNFMGARLASAKPAVSA
jgi:methionyl-tRNA formyltransferase